MKRKVLTAVVVALFVSSAAFAEGKSANFIDANNDGKCDNIGQEKRDGSGKGQGKRKCKQNKGQNKGGNFVDADGDGVCDNTSKKKGCGKGKGQGRRNGKGKGHGCNR